MKFQTQLYVVGIKASKGKMDNGMEFDSTRVYALADLDSSKGNARGQAAAEYLFGDSKNFEPFRHAEFPGVYDVTIEMLTNGKVQRAVIVDMKPARVGKPASASA